MAALKGSKSPLFKHGHKSKVGASPTYNSWRAIIGRCENPNQSCYQRYGAIGIAMCKRWRESFENFLADMGERPPGTSVDRIDNSRGYEPGNCRWATAKQQSRNRSFARPVEYMGIEKCAAAWAEDSGLTYSALKSRIKNGWGLERALNTPPIKHDHFIELNGESRRITEWADKLGIHRRTLFNRIGRGWTVERALTQRTQRKTKRAALP